MKQIALYVCERCGTQFANKLDAQNCENNHKVPVGIKRANYVSIGIDKTGYPNRINVAFSDGSELYYKR